MRGVMVKIWLAFFALLLLQAGVFTWFTYQGIFDLYLPELEATWLMPHRHLAQALHAGTTDLAAIQALTPSEIQLRALKSLPDVMQLPLSNQEIFYETSLLDTSETIYIPMPDGEQVLSIDTLGYSRYDQAIFITLPTLLSLISGAILWRVIRPVQSNLHQLERAAHRISEGDWKARAHVEEAGPTLHLASTFNHMAGRISALIASQKHLIRAISHELRTPLAQVQLGAELLAREGNMQRRQDRLVAIHRDIEALDELVDELLTYSRLELPVRESRHAHRIIAADGILQGVVGDHRRIAEAKGIRVVEGKGVACDLVGEDRYFRRAIGNILSNAIRHARGEVNIHCALIRGRLCVEIDDDGPGISPAERQRVFEPFERLLEGEASEGYGMGLAIVKRVFERYGVEYAISASPVGGCRFTCYWPVHGA